MSAHLSRRESLPRSAPATVAVFASPTSWIESEAVDQCHQVAALDGMVHVLLFLILGRLFSSNYPNATLTATVAFLATWLIVAGFNMWVGVARAGYSVTEELPIFLLIFGLPALAAVLLKWKFVV